METTFLTNRRAFVKHVFPYRKLIPIYSTETAKVLILETEIKNQMQQFYIFKNSCLDAILTNALINSAKRVTSFLRASCPFLFTITRV